MRTMRVVLAAAVLAVGCAQRPPAGDPSITADLACETAHMLVRLAATPAPKPVTDKCDNCNGTGRVGDGRVWVTCAVCNGTGKKAKSVLVPAKAPVCNDGSCYR